MSKLFISYHHGDKEFASRLAVDLKRFGVDVWFDEHECKIGDSLVEAVQKGIASSEYLGVVLSPRSVASFWVQRELEAGFAEEENKKRVKVLPLLLADCEVPLFLAGRRRADFRSSTEYAESLRQLVELLGVRVSQSPPLSAEEAEALIRCFAATQGRSVRPVIEAKSPLGTTAYKARLKDGKGVLYCHASGQHRGRVFYARDGIGWYYEHTLEGSESLLGLPTSHEEMRDVKGGRISYFECGYIEWSKETLIARAITTGSGGESVIGERKL